MQFITRNTLLPVLGLAAGLGLTTAEGCGDDALGNLAARCGLDVNCEAGGFVEGNASISGVASIDSFFGAAIDLNAKMSDLNLKLRTQLDGIALSLGLEGGASGADIKAALTAKLDASVQGGLKIDFKPAECSASIEVSASAAAECDVNVDAGEVSVKCEGSCAIEAGAEVGCEADATLVCTGTAPGLACEGECSGSCTATLDAAAGCEGTCRGTCEAGGSTMDGFDGKCNGMCTGECAVEVTAEANCEGKCEGSCEYTPPSGECEASASAKCEANAGASIDCDAGCEGTVEPPSVSAECEATVEAKASASIQCTPPSLNISFDFSAELAADVNAQAEFRAWLEGFRGHFSGMLAATAEAEVVGGAAVSLIGSASGALRGAVEDLTAEADIAALIGAGCALPELEVAGSALTSTSGELTANVSASAEIFAVFAG